MNDLITKIIENAERVGLNSFGIRAESKTFEIGAELDCSGQFGDTWDQEELDGTCALQVSYDGFEVEDIDGDLKSLEMYLNDNCKAILIGGTASYEGTDCGETVIKNAQVLHVF